MMDLDGSGKIGDADFHLFIQRYAGPDSDCDGNGVNDLRDILDTPERDQNGNGHLDDCERPFRTDPFSVDALLDLVLPEPADHR